MKFDDFKRHIDFINDTNNTYTSRNGGNLEVGIQVKRIGSVGGTPLVDLHSVRVGFDWDRGKVIITPVTPLRETDRDEIQMLIDKYEELGSSYMTIQNLKKEVKKLKEKIASLEENQKSSKSENQDSPKTKQPRAKKALQQDKEK
jgi:hypothetical protein